MAEGMDQVSYRRVTAGDLDWIVQRHGELYAQEAGFDDSFSALVRGILDDWFPHHDPERETGILAERVGQRLGTIFCVRLEDDTAKLRLFLLEPQARGLGIGRELLARCLVFACAARYRRMSLWTHESHAAACALYRAEGFTLVTSRPVHSFGQDLVEQHWQVELQPA